MENKSEILFVYETSYNIPNGDPFTGEQRYDEETKKILVSDVRIKRFVRDYLTGKDDTTIYVKQKDSAVQEEENVEGEVTTKKEGSGSARRIDELIAQFKKEIVEAVANIKKGETFSEALFVLKKCIDVRLFGGISTKKQDAVNLTGPVQFSLLNSSFNEVDLRMHQNTTCFESKQGKGQGSIGTTTLVPYSLIQIHGWVNPKVAEKTELTDKDLKLLFEGMWYGTSGDGSSHSRSKVGQNSVLLLEIVYAQNNQKIYGVDRLIKLNRKDDKKGEQLRSMDDYKLDFEKLFTQMGKIENGKVEEALKNSKIKQVNYYTEINDLQEIFEIQDPEKNNGEVKPEFKWKEKFKKIEFLK